MSSNMHFYDLFFSGRFSDVVIKGRDRDWRLHKNILSSLKYFDRLFRAAGDTMKEVDLTNENPTMVNLLLYSAYTSCIPRSESDLPVAFAQWLNRQEATIRLDRHLEIIAFATKFKAIELLEVLIDNLRRYLLESLGKSTIYGQEKVRSVVYAFLRKIYSDDADALRKSLREPIITLVYNSVFNIRAEKEFQALFKDKESTFGFYLIKAFGGRLGPQCPLPIDGSRLDEEREGGHDPIGWVWGQQPPAW